jgi:hypothetical protein
MRTSHRRTSRRRAATRTRAKRSFLKKTFFFLSHFYIWSSLHLDIFLHRPLEYPYDTCLRREDQGGPLFPFYIEKVLWGKNGDAGATNSRPMPVVVLLALNKVPHQSAPPILIDGLGRQKKGPCSFIAHKWVGECRVTMSFLCTSLIPKTFRQGRQT